MSLATSIGLLIDGTGAFLLLVPDLPNGRVQKWFYQNTPRVPVLMEHPINRLIKAREELFDGRGTSRLRYDSEKALIDAIYPVLCEQFGFDEDKKDDVNEIRVVHKGFTISYRGGREQSKTGFDHRNERVAQGVQRAIERRFVVLGAIALVVGFLIQALASVGALAFVLGILLQALGGLFDLLSSLL